MPEVGDRTAELTVAEALRRAQGLVPVLKERAAHTEELRRVPPENVRDLLASGLHRLAVPPRFGGLDLGYDLMLEVAAELGRGCGATAWCYCLWAAHAWLVGHWPLAAQEEVFQNGPDALVSSSLRAGTGQLTPVPGGYRLSGRWQFSSGCDNAGWLMLGVPADGGWRWALVPAADCVIVDTWFVTGLRGTGSKDIEVRDAWVPAHRVVDRERIAVSDWTGWEIHRHYLYRLPVYPLLGWDLVSPLLGMAQGMIDEFTALLAGTSGPGRSAHSTVIQLRLAEASARVDAARALLRQDLAQILEQAQQGKEFTDLDRARYLRDRAFITDLCVQATNRLFEVSGAHSLFDSVTLQRIYRDVNAGAHRDGLIFDLAGQQYGRIALGLEA